MLFTRCCFADMQSSSIWSRWDVFTQIGNVSPPQSGGNASRDGDLLESKNERRSEISRKSRRRKKKKCLRLTASQAFVWRTHSYLHLSIHSEHHCRPSPTNNKKTEIQIMFGTGAKPLLDISGIFCELRRRVSRKEKDNSTRLFFARRILVSKHGPIVTTLQACSFPFSVSFSLENFFPARE